MRDLKQVVIAPESDVNSPSRVIAGKMEDYVHGKPTRLTSLDGGVTLVNYNTRGQLASITGSDGDSVVLQFDETQGSATLGRLLAQKTVIGPIASPTKTLTTQFRHDAYGRLDQITNPENEAVTLEYDAIEGNPLRTLDRVTKVISPDGKSERVEWWALSVKKTFDVENKATVYDIDGNGEVESVMTPDNKTITYERGNCCGGAIDTLVDAGGNRTHWKHDILGRVTEKWLKWDPSHPDGSHSLLVATHTFDGVGRPSTTIDARGNTRTVVYDGQDRMSEINYTIPALLPDGSPNATAPTPNVSMTYETLAQSLFGRVKTVSQAGGANLEVYEYVPVNPGDTVYGDGQLKKVSKGTHSVTYTFDAQGRRATSKLTLPTAGVVVPGTSEMTTTRVWDELGRLTAITNPLGTEEIHYDGDTGRVTWTKLGNLKTTYGYDTSVPGEHRLGSIQPAWNNDPGAYTEHTYSYDPVGRMATWTRNIANSWMGSHWAMNYDTSEQLENVSVESWYGTPNPPDEHFYQYDAAGNRTSEQRGGAVRSWAPNTLNQFTEQTAGGKMLLKGDVNVPSNVTVTPLPLSGGAAIPAASSATKWKAKVSVGEGINRFSVSATQANVPQGQVAQSTTRTLQVEVPPQIPSPFTYDADGNMLSDGYTSCKWDAENRLVWVNNSAFGTVEFGYDAFNRRVSLVEKPDQGTATKSLNLLWEGLTIVGQVDNTPSVNQHTRLFFGNGERRLFHAGAPLNLLYTRDHLGSIRELVDASTGYVRAAYDYTPYGIRSKLQSIGGDLDSDFGYTGHYTNERTGLVLAPYRAYSPELGRWISRDPIEEDGGINLYGYVENGPLGAVDPLGLAPGDSFPSFESAMWDALGYANGQADKTGKEHAGWVYQKGNSSGNYTYLCEAGEKTSFSGKRAMDLRPRWDSSSELFHSHTSNFNNASNDENFSPSYKGVSGDMGWSDSNQIPIWLVTPSGECKRYAPGTPGARPHNGKQTWHGNVKQLVPRGGLINRFSGK